MATEAGPLPPLKARIQHCFLPPFQLLAARLRQDWASKQHFPDSHGTLKKRLSLYGMTFQTLYTGNKKQKKNFEGVLSWWPVLCNWHFGEGKVGKEEGEHVSLIIDLGWTPTPQVNIVHGRKNCRIRMSDKKAEGPGNTLHLCSFRPCCREVQFSGGSLKKMVCVHLHCKHVLWLVVKQMVSPLIPQWLALKESSEAKPHPNHRPKLCVWLMREQEDVDQRKARQQFQDTRLHTKSSGADCILETVPTYPRGTEQSAA